LLLIKILQVEYAMEAVGQAGTCLGILATDGVVIVAEKKNQHKLLDTNPSVAEKIYRIDDHLAVGIAGITSDANALIAQLRLIGKLDFFSH
jgi:20S proteasome subunit alpha 3